MKRKLWDKKYALFYFSVLVAAIIAALVLNRFFTVETDAEWTVRKNVVVLDAGHGGEDGGAVSCTGIAESQINLQISLRIHDLLKMLGIDCVMLRKEDISLHTEGKTIAQRKISDLKNRVAMINNAPRGVLLSIHQNTFPDGRYHGAQIFYANIEGSKELAEELQRHIVNTINAGSRRLPQRAKGVYLMEHVTIPAVLIECGFLSNPEEESLLRNESYQKKLCCVIAATMCDYLDRNAID